MKKQRNDFEKLKNGKEDSWYDLEDDWGLIEASIAKQYGLRIRNHTDMPFSEFCNLVSGLMPDTPLGQVVAVRAEKDTKTIKNFTPDQRRIYSEWRLKKANEMLTDMSVYDKQMADLSKTFAAMFSKEVKQ